MSREKNDANVLLLKLSTYPPYMPNRLSISFMSTVERRAIADPRWFRDYYRSITAIGDMTYLPRRRSRLLMARSSIAQRSGSDRDLNPGTLWWVDQYVIRSCRFVAAPPLGSSGKSPKAPSS